MMDRIYQISEELISVIQGKEQEISDIIRDVPPIISNLEDGFVKLKDIVSNFIFPSEQDEIFFFKDTKPRLFSKLIYFRKIYQMELNRPVSNYETVKSYMEKEHEQINLFYNKNAECIY